MVNIKHIFIEISVLSISGGLCYLSYYYDYKSNFDFISKVYKNLGKELNQAQISKAAYQITEISIRTAIIGILFLFFFMLFFQIETGIITVKNIDEIDKKHNSSSINQNAQ